MNLFELLTRKNRNTDYSPNIPPLQAQPQLDGIQLGQNGEVVTNVDIQPERKVTVGDKFNNFGNKLTNALFGTSAQPTDSVNTDGEMSATVSENPRIGGFLNNVRDGYRENVSTPFNISNLEPNKNKGLGYRIGEGLGSIARGLDSPAGKMLLAYGASKMLGDTNPLEQAFTAGAVNFNNEMNDKIYRNDLISTQQQALINSPEFNQLSKAEQAQILNQLHADSNYMGLSKDEAKGLNTEQYRAKLGEKQANMKNQAIEEYLTGRQSQQLQDIANKVNGYRGYLGEKTYGNLINSQQLRDNAAYRKMFYDAQQANLREQMEFRRQQALADKQYKNLMLEFQREKEANDRAYQNAQLGLTKRGQDLNYSLGLDRINADKNKANEKIQAEKKEQEKANNQIRALASLFKDLPQNKVGKGFQKITGLGATGLYAAGYGGTSTTSYDAVADALATSLARKNGEKGNLSDSDIKRWRKPLPNITDTPEQAQAKFNALHKIYGFPQINIIENKDGQVF